MAQTTEPPDPAFVATLTHDISGVQFADASRYDADKIKEEFPKCTRELSLFEDEQFMHNLMFIVRKREVFELRQDVERVSNNADLNPEAAVSALKTWYACGDQADRDKIDDRLVTRLKQKKRRFDELEITPELRWAGRIGGPRTMELLKMWHKEVAEKQSQAEKEAPGDHIRIGQLDQMRSSLDTRILVIAERMKVVAQGEVERASSMAELYLRGAGKLGCWGYKELVRKPTPGAVQGVRSFLNQKLSTLVPAEGLSEEEYSEMLKDCRLRGLCLLQAMGEQLNPREQAYFDQHAEEAGERRAYFRPGYDWEDVLD